MSLRYRVVFSSSVLHKKTKEFVSGGRPSSLVKKGSHSFLICYQVTRSEEEQYDEEKKEVLELTAARPVRSFVTKTSCLFSSYCLQMVRAIKYKSQEVLTI